MGFVRDLKAAPTALSHPASLEVLLDLLERLASGDDHTPTREEFLEAGVAPVDREAVMLNFTAAREIHRSGALADPKAEANRIWNELMTHEMALNAPYLFEEHQ